MKDIALLLEKTLDTFASTIAKEQLDWHTKPQPGKWSNIEIIGHLIDSANNNIQRLVRGTYENDFKIVYRQETWVTVQKYAEASAPDVIQLWLLLNKQFIRLLRNYPADRMYVSTDIGKHLPEIKTMHEVAQGYLEHLQHHLNQIIPL